MSDSNESSDLADVDPGDPIPELSALWETPSNRFVPRIRNSIHRRIFAADAVDFSVKVLFETFFSYLTLVIQAITGSEHRKGERS